MLRFSHILISWYQHHKRDLPWRNIKDPYKVWLSEVILQQTQVVQGLPYYQAFLKKYPTLSHLAKAPQDDVLKTWQGLGYYSRARNLHYTAKLVMNEHKGSFPNSYQGLIKLKGVGPYTAAAIASFCFQEAVPVMDGNVIRVISRLFGVDGKVESKGFKDEIYKHLYKHISKEQPDIFNQAMMEFGSLQCTPKNPNCEVCPFKNTCFAYKKGMVELLPPKKQKLVKKERFFDYVWIFDQKKRVFLEKRGPNDIWEGLYEPFLIENQKKTSEKQVLNTKILPFLQKLGQKIEITAPKTTFKHILSHQNLFIRFWVVNIKTEAKKGGFIDLKHAHSKGMPILVRKVWGEFSS